MKNDLAFVIAGTLNLYEHQSTYNPNMSVRFLIYLAEEYQKLMEKSRALSEYFQFVEISRKDIAEGRDYQEALNLAIDYYIGHGILSEFLRGYRAEVLGMLLEEFDVDKYERSLKEEGREALYAVVDLT